MDRLCRALIAQGLSKKQQAVEAELQRSLVGLEGCAELAFRRDAPKVNDALGTFLCAGKLLQQQIVIFRTLRVDRERCLAQSLKLLTRLRSEHLLPCLREPLHKLCAQS